MNERVCLEGTTGAGLSDIESPQSDMRKGLMTWDCHRIIGSGALVHTHEEL